MMRVTFKKSRVRDSRMPGSVRAKPNGRATRPRPEDVADFLIFFGDADNWFDLYKTIEMAEKIGGGEHALTAIFPRLKLAKTTANSHRHARRHQRGYVPPTPLSFGDAYEVVRDVVSAVLEART